MKNVVPDVRRMVDSPAEGFYVEGNFVAGFPVQHLGYGLNDVTFAVFGVEIVGGHGLGNENFELFHRGEFPKARRGVLRAAGRLFRGPRTRRQARATPSHSKRANLMTAAPVAIITTALRNGASILNLF